MAKWKLIRQTFGSDELNFLEGDEVTIGRGLDNTVTLSSLVISRNHCKINFKSDEVLVTDLKSSNGIYIGLKRITPNIPHNLVDGDIIGFGWTVGAPLVNIADNEKYIFKLTKEECRTPVSKRILFQNEQELDDIEMALKDLTKEDTNKKYTGESPVNNSKSNLKRKLSIENIEQKLEDKIIILSDSDVEICNNQTSSNKKLKQHHEAENKNLKKDHVKTENDDLQYEAFNVKQEYLGYDDEPTQIGSDDDSESEHWFLRLSQSSPGKPFTKIVKNSDNPIKQNDNSYSQAEDFVVLDLVKGIDESEEEFSDDLTEIPLLHSVEKDSEAYKSSIKETFIRTTDKCIVVDSNIKSNESNLVNDELYKKKDSLQSEFNDKNQDEMDGVNLITDNFHNSTLTRPIETSKKIQLIEPIKQPFKIVTGIPKIKTTTKHEKQKTKKKSHTKKQMSNSQKEERKKKLKEIATKGREENELTNTSSINSSKPVNAKVTTLNRGVFLTNIVQPTVDPKKKISLNNHTSSNVSQSNESVPECEDDVKVKRKETTKHTSKKQDQSKSKNKDNTKSPISDNSFKTFDSDTRIPVKLVKPLIECDGLITGKPFSKVEPSKTTSAVKKMVKKVCFTDEAPKVIFFDIDPGNKMKRTSSIKTSLLDVRHMPIFSLEKLTLIKILRWNPHWLDEQMHNNDPPPILGHNNPPMNIFHSFTSLNHYIQLVGDLLLMEIWECLTQGYMRLPKHNYGLKMQIESLPPVPPQERYFDLFNLSFNISLPTTEIKSVPRVGDVMLVTFGPENAKCSRFLFVQNVRCLPSPPNNIHSFFAISMYATFTEKMGSLRPGEILYGKTLAYINKELMLFEAMEYLSGSPLREVILKPEPHHFIKLKEPIREHDLKSQWTITLNPSQKLAVCSSISAALGDRPSIQMVQGPPGTGKSSVICAIVMTYFYNAAGKKQNKGGKILICATSNAAVDELVIRLLNIRQSLPKAERFRMVRVGRAEAMHPRARDVSSQHLAQRDAARVNNDPSHPGLAEEISHLEAKINMWRTQAQDARDPVRVAYCQSRMENLVSRIAQLRKNGGAGCGEEARPEEVAQAERRIIEGAAIIVTTLASAHNYKMRGLKGKIALCIVDEAGQAIEPETLIPLTLDVTRITLIGDPQQLPGFICSQRAKKYGLGESLFSRLTSSTEHWKDSPVVLLNQQYRMHRDIADYPNRAFYDGRIQTMAPPRVDLNIPPYCIISIASGDKGQGISGANEIEAWGVARIALALCATLHGKGLSLAVITPYSAQRDLVRRYLRMLQDSSENQVEVNTVDSFQGQERDVVVVSLARSHGVGFLTDAGRMNVMLTRARHSLLVCLNPHAMMKNNQWRTLVEDAQRRMVYRILPNKMCQGSNGRPIPHEQILYHITQ